MFYKKNQLVILKKLIINRLILERRKNMLTHAYLIMAHSEFEQLRMLVEMLDYPGNDIYIHVDKKAKELDKEEIKKNIHYSKVYIYQEFPIYWGHYSQTQCEVFLLRESTKKEYDYYHLLSGADLPLCSQKVIQSFFDENKGKEYVRYWGEKYPESYYSWLSYYHPLQKYLRISSNSKVNQVINCCENAIELIQKLIGVNRIRNNSIQYQKGATWFSITKEFANYVVEKENWIKKIFSNTRSSDEVFLQTILHNSQFECNRYEKKYELDGLSGTHYIDWKRGKPYIFRISDYDELSSCGYLFARKFSYSIDKEIINVLYNRIRNENAEEIKQMVTEGNIEKNSIVYLYE